MYIKSLKINNLRCFQDAELNFQYPGLSDGSSTLPNINLILGDNGSGKTTVLKAIALSILSKLPDTAGYYPYYLIRRGEKTASITSSLILNKLDSNSIKDHPLQIVQTNIISRGDLEILETQKEESDIWGKIYREKSPAFIIIGYGATRRVEISDSESASLPKRRRLRYQRFAGLFEDHIALTSFSRWLDNLKNDNDERFDEIKSLFKMLLPPEFKFTGIITNKDGLLFRDRGVEVPFRALSDGYRSYIGWIGDLLYHLNSSCPKNMKLRKMSGIVLVDEVDLHLHPEWQRTVASMISKAFPNLQFILTTHSPIVAGTLYAKNIHVSEVQPSGVSIMYQLEERIFGLNADQILLSSYFNLETSRAPGFEDELNEIAQRAQTGDTSAVIEYMRKL